MHRDRPTIFKTSGSVDTARLSLTSALLSFSHGLARGKFETKTLLLSANA